MYFENEKLRSRQRSNDEFFRRMNGEDFRLGMMGSDIPTFSRTDIPKRDEIPKTTCKGTPNSNAGAIGACQMPSLAMVYAPVQAWQGVLSPEDGLRQGSIFADLIKPFEMPPFSAKGHTEGGCCK